MGNKTIPPVVKKFASLFTDPDVGQILVKLDVDKDDFAEIRVFIWPDHCGVCSMAMSFRDPERTGNENWDVARSYFHSIGYTQAQGLAGKLLSDLVDSLPDTGPLAVIQGGKIDN